MKTQYMARALELAELAQAMGEVPVGAVLVLDNEIIGEGWNQSISACDPTAHAEVIALRNAAKKFDNYRLVNSTLYVTLEPCIMCVGAMIHARIQHLVYGADDPKTGAVNSVMNLLNTDLFNHRITWQKGVAAQESSQLLKTFFQNKRKDQQTQKFRAA